jgi:hypothetical protein
MRQMKIAVSMLASLMLALSASGQQSAAGNLVEVHINKPKPGMEKQYEQARKKHMAWHASQKDTWPWETWEILDGENGGSFVVDTVGHSWKDYDVREKFNDADAADANASFVPTLQEDVQSYYMFRPEMSLGSGPATPSKMASVTFFMLTPEGVNTFIDSVKKVGEGAKKTNYPAKPTRWYQLVNGGHGPQFVLVQERDTWADFQGPEKNLDAMMEEAYGKDEGAVIMNNLRKSFRSTYSEIIRRRPDLSYMPAK